MDDGTAIRVEGLGKCFQLRRRGTRTVKGAALEFLRSGRARGDDFWALRDVSFTVRQGETLGIVGANGAGKSTLLSLLAGTKTPTEGAIETHGKISSLLELGAGFHPDLSGRENVFLAGALMGLPQRHMAARFDAIVDFAELRDFIDQPVKHYSSGMYVRLGFSVAIEVDPDILLLDEVLAVGDAAFQRKCLRRMDELRQARKTMLIISHDLDTIKAISNRILFLDGGRVQGLGDPRAMVEHYDSQTRSREAAGLSREWGTGDVTLTDVQLLDAAGEPCERIRAGESLTARIRYRSRARTEDPVFGFALATTGGNTLYGNNTQIEGTHIPYVEGEGTLTLAIRDLRLGPGNYLLSFSVHSSDHRINYHRLDHCFPLRVDSDRPFEGVYLPVTWTLGAGDEDG
jgi:ABC-type polysaccharide/polyol phosphate transport system ATPase subunit